MYDCSCFIIQVGQEVEYSVYSREKGGKVSAEGVKLLAKGSIPPPPCKEESLYGKVVRPLRSVNPDQVTYSTEYGTDPTSWDAFWHTLVTCYNKSHLSSSPPFFSPFFLYLLTFCPLFLLGVFSFFVFFPSFFLF